MFLSRYGQFNAIIAKIGGYFLPKIYKFLINNSRKKIISLGK